MKSVGKEIVKYTVTVQRANFETVDYVRAIRLQLNSPQGLGFGRIRITFHENWDGDLNVAHTPNLPIQDYDDIYKILQTEKPVFIYISFDEDSLKLENITLTSNADEPVGEGPKDESP